MPFDALRTAYDRDGFAVWPAALDDNAVRPLVAAVEGVQAGVGTLDPDRGRLHWLERDLPDSKRGGVPAAETGNALFLIGDPTELDPAFAAALVHPAVVGLAHALLGTPDIVLHFANATIKHPRFGSGIAWHRDFPNGYISPERSAMVRIMLCLDGMDAENGPTRFLPGSHRIDDAAALAEPDAKAEAAAGASKVVEAHGPPGTLVAIHPKIVHGGPPNHSPRFRRNLVLQWGIAGVPFAAAEWESLTGLPPEAIAGRFGRTVPAA